VACVETPWDGNTRSGGGGDGGRGLLPLLNIPTPTMPLFLGGGGVALVLWGVCVFDPGGQPPPRPPQ